MPFNEFVLFRNIHLIDEKQVILLTGNEIDLTDNQIPDNIDIHKVGKNPFKIYKHLKSIIKKAVSNGNSYVVHLHSIRGSFSTLLGILFSKIKKHTIYTIHSTYNGFRFYNKIFCFFNSLFSNYTTCVSQTSYNCMPSLVRKIKKDHILPLQNGVNIERIDNIIYQKNKRNDNIFTLAYIARFVPIKNHKFLIDVLAELPNKIHFVFIGTEDSKNAIREYATRKGVEDRIEFTGLISREEVYKKLKEVDAYISSSTLEGLPISVLEAMYSSLPCLLSNISQHKEIGENVEGVFLLDFDVKQWVEIIEKISNVNDKMLSDYGNNCKKHVIDCFSLEKMHNKYDLLYSKIEKTKQ